MQFQNKNIFQSNNRQLEVKGTSGLQLLRVCGGILLLFGWYRYRKILVREKFGPEKKLPEPEKIGPG